MHSHDSYANTSMLNLLFHTYDVSLPVSGHSLVMTNFSANENGLQDVLPDCSLIDTTNADYLQDQNPTVRLYLQDHLTVTSSPDEPGWPLVCQARPLEKV